MPVPRPDTKPCVVSLFTSDRFADFTPKPFTFTPPAACPFPWAKVVLHVNLAVGAGRQFDRTAVIGLGRSTIFFGTTAEPSHNLGPSWSTERDLTDLSTLFRKTQSGQISIGNVVNSTYTSSLYGGASLQFYPPDKAYPAPTVADIVLPLADNNGNPVGLNTSASSVSTSFTPPRYVERAYLDVIAQSQSNDEFWYTCFPNNLAAQLDNCGNTAFRESEISVDGKPAGVAPVYPWIYTGGIDPYLWRPIPGVQTLDFKPYRVDISPFAGTLDDGAKHQVSISVFNADSYFAATGNLLLFLDRAATAPLTGKIDSNDLSATPVDSVKEGGGFNKDGDGVGTIDTASKRRFTIVGHVATSHGTVSYESTAAIAFTQHQSVASSSTEFVQDIAQDTAITAYTATTTSAGTTSLKKTFDWPLKLNYSYVVNSDGSAAQRTAVSQGFVEDTSATGGFTSSFSDRVTPVDTLNFDASGNFTGPSGTASGENITYSDSAGGCYGRRLTATGGVLTQTRSIQCK